MTLRGGGDVHAGGESCALAGEGVTLEQLRHCLSVLISARQDADGSPEGAICVVVCRTGIAVQRKWRSLHPEEKPPADKALNRWMNQFNL